MECMFAVLILSTLFVAGACLMVVELCRAPEGVEDADGFHVVAQSAHESDAALTPIHSGIRA